MCGKLPEIRGKTEKHNRKREEAREEEDKEKVIFLTGQEE